MWKCYIFMQILSFQLNWFSYLRQILGVLTGEKKSIKNYTKPKLKKNGTCEKLKPPGVLKSCLQIICDFFCVAGFTPRFLLYPNTNHPADHPTCLRGRAV